MATEQTRVCVSKPLTHRYPTSHSHSCFRCANHVQQPSPWKSYFCWHWQIIGLAYQFSSGLRSLSSTELPSSLHRWGALLHGRAFACPPLRRAPARHTTSSSSATPPALLHHGTQGGQGLAPSTDQHGDQEHWLWWPMHSCHAYRPQASSSQLF